LRLERARDGYSAYRFSIIGQSEGIRLLVTRNAPGSGSIFALPARWQGTGCQPQSRLPVTNRCDLCFAAAEFQAPEGCCADGW